MSRPKPILLFTVLNLLIGSKSLWAAESILLPGQFMGLIWCIPFAGLLLSIALMPLIAPNFWHHNYGKIGFGWSLLTAIMLMESFGIKTMSRSLSLTLLHHYIPFIILIGTLYIITGGIRVRIEGSASPLRNTFVLSIGTLLASWMGTTGAAMLFIHPFLLLNKDRQFRQHLVIFFIILVCNIGGALTPIGDPPLLIGFLKGVPFLWPLVHLFKPFMMVAIPVLVLFYIYDFKLFKKEGISYNRRAPLKISLLGYDNFLLLILAISCIFLTEVEALHHEVSFLSIPFSYQDIVRDLSFFILAFISLKGCNQRARSENNFSWAPLVEVGLLFIAIFITVEPVLAMLKAGKEGAFSNLYTLLTTSQNQPLTIGYFWLTGLLSSFLDNAPTYLIFFNLAGGNVTELTTTLAQTLAAISSGAVFMGALTYIGNAPNFMVKAMVETYNIEMPNFFHYIIWVSLILGPLFVLLSMALFL